MYRTAIIIMFLFAAFTLTAQDKYNASVDRQTYNLFMKSDWEALRDAGSAAIEKGIDFYFLRMRLGVSYYQEENYISAVPHFEKAIKYQPKDSTAQEYLYYSYLFSGQESEANLLAQNLPSHLKRKFHYKTPEFFKGAYTEAGYSFNQNFKNITKGSIIGNQYVSGIQNIFKNETYVNLSLLHSLGNRVSLFQGYNNIAVNYSQQFEDKVNGIIEFPASVKQNEYYLNMGVNLGKGFNVNAAIHYMNVKVDESELTSTSNDFIGNLSLSKRIGHTELGFTSVFANMNKGKQNQNTFTFVWYPLGNLNLYNVSGFIFHTNKANDSSDAITRFLFDEKLGFKLADKLWLEAVFTTGPIFNYSEGNAFIVYNNIDNIKYKVGINIISPVSENVELSFRYLLLSQEYNNTNTNSNFTNITTTNNLLIHKLIGGIKWTF